MADGLFYLDSRTPFVLTEIGAVTLATTDKALYPAASFPVLGANYFGYAGKKFQIRLFGRITTAATPGNGTFDIYWGSGADANGTILASSVALTLIANQTNASWQARITVVARTLGATGTMFASGDCDFSPTVNAAAGGILPGTAPAGVTVDTTAANIISVQFKRSGSTAETMQVSDMDVVAMN